MTHINSEEKGSTSFVWRAHRDELPSFSGFLVHDYRSYSVLEADSAAYLDFTQQRNDTLKGELLLLYHSIT